MPVTRLRSTRWAGPLVAATAALVTLAAGAWLPLDALRDLMREHGPVENATVILYIAAIAAVCAARNSALSPSTKVAGVLVLACCVTREMSLRKWLMTIDAAGLCCSPPQVRAIMGALLAIFVVSLLWLTVRYAAAVGRGFMRGEAVSVTLVTMLASAALSQVLDSLPKLTMTLAAYPLSEQCGAVAQSLEEVFELLLPVLIIIALVQARPRRRSAQP